MEITDKYGNGILKYDFVNGKSIIVLGDGISDVVIKSGKVSIDTGLKTFDIPVSINSKTNSIVANTVETYQTKKELPSLDAIDDSTLIYIVEEECLYIKYNNVLVLLTSRNSDKIYLSFVDEQLLTKSQKLISQKNLGLIVEKKEDLYSSFTEGVSYIGMCVYVIEDMTHYKLIGNPIIKSNWIQTYVSTESGGEIESSILITYKRPRKDIYSLLHIEGYYNNDFIPQDLKETVQGLTIGSRALSTGLAIWTKENGDSYISLQNSNPLSTLNFVTCGRTENHNVPLKISNTCVAINGNTSEKYNTVIGGLTRILNNVYIDSPIMTESFASGFGGRGMKLYPDQYSRWTLELDNIRVRGRMDVYELVFNQIRAQNGSLWVTDGAKIKSFSKSYSYNIFVNYRSAGRYTKTIDPVTHIATYNKVVEEDMPKYYFRQDALTPVYYKLGLGYGDYNLVFENNQFVYKQDTRDLYIKRDDGSYSLATPTHSFNEITKQYELDSNGTFVKIDEVNVYIVTIEDLCPFVVGDLIRLQRWDSKKNSLIVSFGRISEIVKAGFDKSEFEVQVYEGSILLEEAPIVRTGNQTDELFQSFSKPGDISDYRSLDINDETMFKLIKDLGYTNPLNDGIVRPKYPERTGAVYLTSSDSESPFIDVLDGMNTHNAFNPADYPDRDIQVAKDRLKVRMGKLTGITDLEMGLTGNSKIPIFGIFTDNGFFRGSLVAKFGKIGDFYLNSGALFVFNDGINNRMPTMFLRSNLDYLYIKEDGSGSNQPMDNGIINRVNINKLFGNNNCGMLLDPTKDSFSLGNKLSYRNGTLIIGEVDGIGDLKTVITNMQQGLDTEFVKELKNNFTVITGGLINSSVLRLGGVTKDPSGAITGWVDRAGMSGLDDAGENSVRFWAGSTLADRNTAPFRIYQNGSFVSEKGTIAGWTIGQDALYKNLSTNGSGIIATDVIGDATYYSGCTYEQVKSNIENALFYVTNEGRLKAVKGKIAGWGIDEEAIEIDTRFFNTKLNSYNGHITRVGKYYSGGNNSEIRLGDEEDQYVFGTTIISTAKIVSPPTRYADKKNAVSLYVKGAPFADRIAFKGIGVFSDGALISSNSCIEFGVEYLNFEEGYDKYIYSQDRNTTFIVNNSTSTDNRSVILPSINLIRNIINVKDESLDFKYKITIIGKHDTPRRFKILADVDSGYKWYNQNNNEIPYAWMSGGDLIEVTVIKIGSEIYAQLTNILRD